MTLKRRPGFSLPELVVATLIASVVFWGTTAMYSYIAKRNRAIEANRDALALTEAVKRDFAADQKKNWLDLSKGGCTANGSTALAFPSFSSTSDFTVTLLDKPALLVLMPNVGSVQHPLRHAIEVLVGAYGTAASAKCMDPATLASDAQYAPIYASETNQMICRCAAAVTPYQTLNVRLKNFGSAQGLYACVQLKSAKGTSQTAIFTKTNPAIAETTLSLVSPTNNASSDCTSLAGTSPANVLTRLDLLVYGGDEVNVTRRANSFWTE